MKNILLSTALAAALTLSITGCGSSSSTKKVYISNDKNKDEPTIVVNGKKTENKTSSNSKKKKKSQVVKLIPTNYFSIDNYTITKILGVDSDKFKLIDGNIYLKSIYTPVADYEIYVMLLPENSNIAIKKDLTVTVVPVAVADTENPIFSLPATMEAGKSITLNATNESGVVTYTTNSNDFTINEATNALIAPDTVGDYNLTVHAEDSSGNFSDVSNQVTVTNPSANTGKALVFDAVSNRVTHDVAKSICTNGKRLATINELKDNVADLFKATNGVDSDDNTPGVKFSSVIWSSTDDGVGSSFGLFFQDGTATNYIINSYDNNKSFFYTCVPK